MYLEARLPLPFGERVTFFADEICVGWFAFSKAKLPLPFGERVTFFAGAKKVTKETPFKI